MIEKKMFKKSQVWVETVVYTLIGLAIIGLLLSIVKPAIDRKKDQILIETSLEMLSNIESEIEGVRYYGVGNTRTIEIKINKGELIIDAPKDKVDFIIKSKYMYSEIGENVSMGRINATTLEKIGGKEYEVSLSLDYMNSMNLSFSGREERKSFHPAPIPYIIAVTNKGKKINNLMNIDFS